MPRIFDNPDTIRFLLPEESDRLDRMHSDLPRSLAECRTCRGRGTFRWWDDADSPQREPVEWECNCVEQFKLHKHLLNCGLDLHHQRLSWSDATAVPETTRELADDYRDHSENYVDAGMGMILYGPPGTGKTLVSVLLAKGLIALGHDTYFTTMANLIDMNAAGWREKADKDWFERRIQNAGVLVVDDLGREHKARADIGESVLDRVLRARVNGNRPTLVTTNLDASADAISELYSGNVLSLIHEVSELHRVTGVSYRPTFAQTKRKEVREGLTRPLVLH